MARICAALTNGMLVAISVRTPKGLVERETPIAVAKQADILITMVVDEMHIDHLTLQIHQLNPENMTQLQFLKHVGKNIVINDAADCETRGKGTVQPFAFVNREPCTGRDQAT